MTDGHFFDFYVKTAYVKTLLNPEVSVPLELLRLLAKSFSAQSLHTLSCARRFGTSKPMKTSCGNPGTETCATSVQNLERIFPASVKHRTQPEVSSETCSDFSRTFATFSR